MASRKTINVTAIVNTLHAKIITAKTVEAKQAYCQAIEEILHDTGNYHGFGYVYNQNQFEAYYSAYTNNLLPKGLSPISAMIVDGLLTEYDRRYILS